MNNILLKDDNETYDKLRYEDLEVTRLKSNNFVNCNEILKQLNFRKLNSMIIYFNNDKIINEKITYFKEKYKLNPFKKISNKNIDGLYIHYFLVYYFCEWLNSNSCYKIIPIINYINENDKNLILEDPKIIKLLEDYKKEQNQQQTNNEHLKTTNEIQTKQPINDQKEQQNSNPKKQQIIQAETYVNLTQPIFHKHNEQQEIYLKPEPFSNLELLNLILQQNQKLDLLTNIILRLQEENQKIKEKNKEYKNLIIEKIDKLKTNSN